MAQLVLVLLLIRLKNWRDSFKPITKRSNRNHVITFDGHLKTALCRNVFVLCRVTVEKSEKKRKNSVSYYRSPLFTMTVLTNI